VLWAGIVLVGSIIGLSSERTPNPFEETNDLSR
jgi:hypothetical protein